MDKTKIIMGIGDDQRLLREEKNAVQRLLLLAKYYIYKTKAAKGILDSKTLQSFIKFQTDAEFYGVRTAVIRSQDEVHLKLCI